MRLRYTRPALADLDQILEHVAARSPQGARRAIRELKATEERVRQFPRSGVLTDVPEVRRVAVPRLPYLIFYRLSGDEITVLAVRHGARDPASMPGRA